MAGDLGVELTLNGPDAGLENLLLLQHVSSYEFGGMDDDTGCGFHLHLTYLSGFEGWVLIRHYGHPWNDAYSAKPIAEKPAILAEADDRAGWCWIPFQPTEGSPDGYGVHHSEDERAMVRLALGIGRGQVTVEDRTDRFIETKVREAPKEFAVGARVKIRAGWHDAGRVATVISGPYATGGQYWIAVHFDDDEDPDWHKSASLELA